MGKEIKLHKLMRMGQEWEWIRWKWKRLSLIYSHLVIMVPLKFILELDDLQFYVIFCLFQINMKRFELFNFPNLTINHC